MTSSSSVVGIEYSADVDLPWEPMDSGALAGFEGGAYTHGSRGSWPLPADANIVYFDLYPIPPRDKYVWRRFFRSPHR